MRDYAIGEDLSEEDNETHLAMFTTTDPVNFEDPLKSEKWRQAMDGSNKQKWHTVIDGVTWGWKEGWSKMERRLEIWYDKRYEKEYEKWYDMKKTLVELY